IPFSTTNPRILNKMSPFTLPLPHAAWDLKVMEQLFSDSRIYYKLDIQKPPIDGNHYYDCKERYSISLTLVCDVNKKFTSYLAGYPGSCHDSYVLSQTCRFLSSLKNSLIKISSFWQTQLIKVIGLRSQLIKGELDHQNVDFNYHLSQSQVRIEHAFVFLKEMKDTIKWIISCVVLHNLLAIAL
ncbi:hypothetical protein VP01_9005g1, partial [Puccinia sorghi]